MDKNNVIAFLKHLAWNAWVEINEWWNRCVTFNAIWWNPQWYFLAWVKKWLMSRASDDDVISKKYMYIDIDIRKEHFKNTCDETGMNWVVLTQEEVEEKSKLIFIELQLNWFDDIGACVYTWNWCHIYFIGDEIEVDKNTYRLWVEYIISMVNGIIEKYWYSCDDAVKNIARLSRLPWTLNPRKFITINKNKEKYLAFDLWNTEAKLEFFDDTIISNHYNNICEYAELMKKQIEDDKETSKKIKSECRDVKKDDWIWWEINKVPIEDLVCSVLPVDIQKDDWEYIYLKENKKIMWARIYKPLNILWNWWSSLIKTQRKTFTPFEFMCFEVFGWDRQETVKFFKDKYNISAKQTETKLIPDKIYYDVIWYRYPDELFDESFDCVMSGELVTIVAESNSWKTTFAMDMIQRNSMTWKKCLYINLEFDIKKVPESQWLFINWKKKSHLTDLNPLTPSERIDLDNYVRDYLNKFDYLNFPEWITIEELSKIVCEKHAEWYWFIVIDTFSRIHWNSWQDSRIHQNRSIWVLQWLCNNLWVTIINLHHTNKNKVMEWSQKILDLSNVLITISPKKDEFWDWTYTEYTLTKDKYVSSNTIKTEWVNRKRVIYKDTP